MRALTIAALLVALAPPALAQARTGRLAVTVSVDGAEISVDGVVVATSPITKPLTLQVGTHTIKVSKRGHAEFIDVVKILPGDTTRLDVELLPFAGVLTVTTTPPGADVLVDGQPVGVSPVELELPPGPHEVRVSLDGHADAARELAVVAGRSYQLELTLAPLAPPRPRDRRRRASITSRWWFWTAAGAVVVGAIAVGIAASSDDDPLSGADRVITPPW